MLIDIPTLRNYIEQGVRDGTRTARFHLVVLTHADAFERMTGDVRKEAATALFGRESYATEINKMLALFRHLGGAGYTLRKR